MMADQRGRDKKGDERELLFQTRNKQKQQQPSLLDRTLCLYLGRERKREEKLKDKRELAIQKALREHEL